MTSSPVVDKMSRSSNSDDSSSLTNISSSSLDFSSEKSSSKNNCSTNFCHFSSSEMFEKAHFLTKLVSASVTAGRKAGRIIQNTLGTDLQIIQKTNAKDLQTIADKNAQLSIVASLRQKFGHDLPIIGEEELGDEQAPSNFIESSIDTDVLAHDSKCPDELKHIKKEDVVVWVDPLDGTSEFTEGLLDHVTVLIGIAVKGVAVAGVIYQPFYGYNRKHRSNTADQWGRSIWAIHKVGVFGLDDHTTPPTGTRIITTTRSHSDKNVVAAIEAIRPDTVIRVGGAGHKVMILMEGRAHAYVFASKGSKKWDTCAPEAILTALGGRLTDLHGNRLQYHKNVQRVNSGGILATAPTVDHQWYLDRIPQTTKDAFPAAVL